MYEDIKTVPFIIITFTKHLNVKVSENKQQLAGKLEILKAKFKSRKWLQHKIVF